MRFFKRHWKLFTFLTVLIVGGVFWIVSRPAETVEVITDTARRERLVQTVDATGDLESIDEVDLSFDISGTIKGVFVEVGDVVEVDQLLAVLNTTELEANVENARQALQAAEAGLSQKYAGSTAEAISVAQAAVVVAEASVDAAEVSLENAQEDLENTKALNASAVKEAELAVQTAEDSLQNTIAATEQSEDELYDDLVATLKSNMIEVRSGLSDADEVLGVDNTLGNNDFEDVLSSLDFQALVSAEQAYKSAVKSRDRAEDIVFDLTVSSEISEIESAVVLVEDALLDTENTLLQTRRALDATAVDTADFTFADLEALKASIDTARNTIQAEYDALQGALQLIDAKTVSNTTALTNAENALKSAEQSLESARTTQTTQIALAEAAIRSAEVNVSVSNSSLAQAEAQLAEVQAGPRGVDVAGDQAQIRRAQADLDAAEARLARAEIRSTISGIVADIALEEGEQVFEGATVITVQTVEDKFKIVVDVPEADIAKVELGDMAELTFDAFGADDFFPAVVTAIDPAEKEIEGVVFYEVTMFLEEGVIPAMRPGMSADVTLLTEDLEDVLTVPQRAVLRRNGTNYVRIPTGGANFEERTVEVGIRGDGGRVQILNGLSEGEEVITSIREVD